MKHGEKQAEVRAYMWQCSLYILESHMSHCIVTYAHRYKEHWIARVQMEHGVYPNPIPIPSYLVLEKASSAKVHTQRYVWRYNSEIWVEKERWNHDVRIKDVKVKVENVKKEKIMKDLRLKRWK